MLQASLTFDDPTGAVDRIGKFLDRMGDWRPALQEIATDFYAEETKVFNSQGAHDGRPRWDELGPLYSKWKGQEYPGRPILECTGALRRSLIGPGGAGVLKIEKRKLTIGTKVGTGTGQGRTKNWNVARLHQGEVHRKGVFENVPQAGGVTPARPPLTFTQNQKNRWAMILAKHIVRDVAGGP